MISSLLLPLEPANVLFCALAIRESLDNVEGMRLLLTMVQVKAINFQKRRNFMPWSTT